MANARALAKGASFDKRSRELEEWRRQIHEEVNSINEECIKIGEMISECDDDVTTYLHIRLRHKSLEQRYRALKTELTNLEAEWEAFDGFSLDSGVE